MHSICYSHSYFNCFSYSLGSLIRELDNFNPEKFINMENQIKLAEYFDKIAVWGKKLKKNTHW